MSEMERLMVLLKAAGIPFDVRTHEMPYAEKLLNGEFTIKVEITQQVVAPSNNAQEIDAICHRYSYGGDQGLLEIMCDSKIVGTPDGVLGYLTADGAFEYFKKWWDDKNESISD